MQAVATTEVFERVPLVHIISVVENHRQAMNETKLAELTESVAAIGVQQPIKVCRRGAECLVMVFGHRRVEASKRAGLTEIPAIVVEGWNDQMIAEAQVVENLLREDLNPIEEALCVQTLLDGGVDLETAASKMNKSKAWARERHDLLRLAKKVQDLVALGRLPLGHAKLIARVGDAKDQVSLANGAIGYCSWVGAKDLQRALADDYIQPLKDLRQAITYKLCKMGSARWPTDVKYAGKRPCDGCPDNTNTEPALFETITLTSKKGNCTNPACFKAKAKAWEKDPVKVERDKKREKAKREKAVAAGEDPDVAAATSTGKKAKPRAFPLTIEEHFAVRLHDYVTELAVRLGQSDANDDDPAAAILLAYTLEGAQECPCDVDLRVDNATDLRTPSELTEEFTESQPLPWPNRLTSDAWDFIAYHVREAKPAYHFYTYGSNPHDVRNVPLPSHVTAVIDCLEALAARWAFNRTDLARPVLAEIEAEITTERAREAIVKGKRDVATQAIAECTDFDLLMAIMEDANAGTVKLAKWRRGAVARRRKELK